ncbi:MAG: hypothetical protein ACREM8_02265, partial [Vulcanimicrobiaceae bacterium]
MHDLLIHVREHVELSAAALALAIACGVPLGGWIARSGRRGELGLGAVGVVRVIPSLAVLALAEPLLGIGTRPALLALA